jgi:prepilin-type N-terminal cleavage/methylation domain-containing protein
MTMLPHITERRSRHSKSGGRRAARGYTMIEVVMTMAIVGIIAAIARPHFDARRLQIVTAQRMVIANLRLARTNAITKNVHFQVTFPASQQLRVSRMIETPAGSGTWLVDSTNVQTIPLPPVTQVASGVVGASFEFNSRGFPLNLNAVRQIDLQDTYGATKSLQLWPSGQVNDL